MRSIKNGAESYQYNFFLKDIKKDIKTAEKIIHNNFIKILSCKLPKNY